MNYPNPTPPPVPYDKHEREVLEVIDERDRAEDAAGKLADAHRGAAGRRDRGVEQHERPVAERTQRGRGRTSRPEGGVLMVIPEPRRHPNRMERHDLVDEVLRLRERVHDAVDECQRRSWDPSSPQQVVIRTAIAWRMSLDAGQPAPDAARALVEAVDALPHIDETPEASGA